MNNRDPFVYKTTDYGRTFKPIVNGIPKSMLSYVRRLHEDPVRRGLLYLGAENAIYISFDDGAHWQPLQNNLPHAPVYGITVQERFNDLVIATYGRGFWIMDDITPLQQLTDQVLASAAHLFPPRPAYRFRPITPPSTTYDDPTVGEDPQYGASINYYLRAPLPGEVTITILDAKGEVVRTLRGTNEAGINRVYWDLRYEPTTQVRLRTRAMYAPHVRPGTEGWRPAPGAGTLSILAPPGTYTEKLAGGGRELTQALTVRKDPNSGGTDAEIAAQTLMLFELRRSLNQAAGLVNRTEVVRSQIEALARVLDNAAIRKAGEKLNRKLIEVEMNLVDLRLTGAGQDGIRFGSKLISKFNYLANGLASGDFKPTSQQVEVQKVLDERLNEAAGKLEDLLGKGLAEFNDMLRRQNIPNIVAPKP